MELSRKPYFHSFEVDFIFTGGLSFFVMGICWAFGLIDTDGKFDKFAYYLVFVCNWPHFAATFLRFYGRKKNIVQNPTAGWGSLFVVIAITYLAFVEQAFNLSTYIRFYFAWSAFHYCMQGMGLTQLYFMRQGRPLSKQTRNAFFVLSCLVFFTSVLSGDTGVSSRIYYGLRYETLNLPVMYFNISAGILTAWFAYFLHCLHRDNALFNRFFLFNMIPFFSVIVWFLLSLHVPVFQLFVPFFHCLQYLQVAWESEKIGKTFKSSNGGLGHFMKWYGSIVIIGIVQFLSLPWMFSLVSTHSYAFCMAIIGLAVQIHHFLVDGFIWKLKDDENKGLLGGIA